MELNYDIQARRFQALSDATRLHILEMLTMGELCACKILEKFQITQPTLSYHMKTLSAAGLVTVRKEGKRTYYALDQQALLDGSAYFRQLLDGLAEKKCVLCGQDREQWELSQTHQQEEIIMEQHKTKLYLLTGFLGSGKTSALLHVLDNLKDKKVGIIQNEFGKIDVDSEILKRDGLVMEDLTRGSIFCTCLRLKFVQALAEMGQKCLDYVFVESSGLADPSNLDEIMEATEAIAGDIYEMCGVICLVDAVNFHDQVRDEITVDRQLKHCHLAVINKADLVTGEELAKVIESVRTYNPKCLVETTTFGDLGTGFLGENLMERQWAENENTTNSVDTKPKTLSLNFEGVVPKAKVEEFLNKMIPDSYRIKGFFHLEDGWQQVDVVGKKIDYKPCEAKECSQLVFISRIGPQIIRPLDAAWNEIVGLPMKLKN